MKWHLVGLVTLFLGCGGSGHVICEVTKQGEYSQCLEWNDVSATNRTAIETFCRAAGHKLGAAECPSGKLAGCKGMITSEGSGVAWYYPTTEVKVVNDVDRDCAAENTLVDPNGNMLQRNGGLCSNITSQAVVVLTFKNSTGAALSMYTRDAACAETFKVTIDPDAIVGQPTKAGEVWVARAGTMDANGAIKLELVAESSKLVEIK